MSVRNLCDGSRASRAATISDCWDLIKASIRRRIADSEVTPRSRLERLSRSTMEGASVSWSGEVSWHASKLVKGITGTWGKYHGVNNGADEENADCETNTGGIDTGAFLTWLRVRFGGCNSHERGLSRFPLYKRVFFCNRKIVQFTGGLLWDDRFLVRCMTGWLLELRFLFWRET